MLKYSLFPVLLGLIACNNTTSAGKKTNPDSTHTIKNADVVSNKLAKDKVVRPNASYGKNNLLAHFAKSNTFPLIIDSAYIALIDSNRYDSLGINEVKQLAQNPLNDSLLQYMGSRLQSFYTIDSVKAKHVFAEWSQKLDIGMMEYANAYALQKIKLDDSTTLLTWALRYSSYDADPLYSGTDVFFTVVTGGKITQSCMLGCELNYIDPPVFYTSDIKGKLYSKGEITLDRIDTDGFVEPDSGSVTRVHYEYAIAKSKITIQEKKAYPAKIYEREAKKEE